MTKTAKQMMDEANSNSLKDISQPELRVLIAEFDKEIAWGRKWFDPNTTDEERTQMCKEQK